MDVYESDSDTEMASNISEASTLILNDIREEVSNDSFLELDSENIVSTNEQGEANIGMSNAVSNYTLHSYYIPVQPQGGSSYSPIDEDFQPTPQTLTNSEIGQDRNRFIRDRNDWQQSTSSAVSESDIEEYREICFRERYERQQSLSSLNYDSENEEYINSFYGTDDEEEISDSAYEPINEDMVASPDHDMLGGPSSSVPNSPYSLNTRLNNSLNSSLPDHTVSDSEFQSHMKLFEEQSVLEIPTSSHNCGLDDCSICCEVMVNPDKVTTLPCQHKFHCVCITPWLLLKRNCPNCRCSTDE